MITSWDCEWLAGRWTDSGQVDDGQTDILGLNHLKLKEPNRTEMLLGNAGEQ